MKTELLIERLIAEGKLNREELDELIAEEQAKSPFPALKESAERAEADGAFLLYDAMEKEFRISSLEEQNAELTYLIMMGGM